MTTNVSTYCASDTASLNRGATKKKSKQSTFKTAVSTDGSRPTRKPAITTPSRYTMTRFDSSRYGYMPNATAVHAAEIAAAATYRFQRTGFAYSADARSVAPFCDGTPVGATV